MKESGATPAKYASTELICRSHDSDASRNSIINTQLRCRRDSLSRPCAQDCGNLTAAPVHPIEIFPTRRPHGKVWARKASQYKCRAQRRGLQGMSRNWSALGATAQMPELRTRRLLRFF